MTIDNFEFVTKLGNGAFGQVNLVKCDTNGGLYALKELSKQEIVRYDRVRHTLREKTILYELDHPNIVRLERTFKTDEFCYLCLEYCQVGELSSLIKHQRVLSLELTKFYTMEIINAFEYLRKHRIVHRDIKPENILLDEHFHVKLSDFGTAKKIDPDEVYSEMKDLDFDFENCSSSDSDNESLEFGMQDSDASTVQNMSNRANSFIGTPLYISPEMLRYNSASYASDLWGLGCIIYQCL